MDSAQEILRRTGLVQGTTAGDIPDPKVTKDKQLLSYHVFKLICIKLGKTSLFCNVDLLVARELELGSYKVLSTYSLF